MTWWTMREVGDMVDYEGEGDTDLFSLQSLKRENTTLRCDVV